MFIDNLLAIQSLHLSHRHHLLPLKGDAEDGMHASAEGGLLVSFPKLRSIGVLQRRQPATFLMTIKIKVYA